MIIQREFEEMDIYSVNPIDDIDENVIEEVKKSPCAYTILSDDKPVCIWGKTNIWQGRCVLWILMGEGSRTCMKRIIELSKETIDLMTEHRIEATTKATWRSGWRFLELLGFTSECVMRKYSSTGEDEVLFARVQ